MTPGRSPQGSRSAGTAQASPLRSTAQSAAARPSVYAVATAHDVLSQQTSPRSSDRTIPPDLRLKRLLCELAAVSRPESIITWMRGKAAAELLKQIGDRDLALSHSAFDDLPPGRHVEHLREMLVELHILPDRGGDPLLARFEMWLDNRLEALADHPPEVRAALEPFARWHHLRRIREDRVRNVDNATRNAKQEITETGKFLIWLSDQHRATIDALTQDHIDEYFSSGTTTRTAARNFLQWRAKTGIGKRYDLRCREARQTPLVSSRERLELIRTVLESDTALLSHRIAALLFLLYAFPVRRIAELRCDQVEVTPAGIKLHLGEHPAPSPATATPPLPRLHGCTRESAHHQQPIAVVLPGNAGRASPHRASLQQTFRRVFGINILAVRNAVLHDLTKELDAASLADLLGYSNQIMNIHAARSGVPMGSYPASHLPVEPAPHPRIGLPNAIRASTNNSNLDKSFIQWSMRYAARQRNTSTLNVHCQCRVAASLPELEWTLCNLGRGDTLFDGVES